MRFLRRVGAGGVGSSAGDGIPGEGSVGGGGGGWRGCVRVVSRLVVHGRVLEERVESAVVSLSPAYFFSGMQVDGGSRCNETTHEP